jgi:hypothetical protein
MKLEDALWNLACKLPGSLSRRALFFQRHHTFASVNNPVTFNEKVHWRILKDRREILAWTCDKLAMKDYASKVEGAMDHGLRIPRTLWSGTDVRELEKVELPDRWVLKPNHRSGLVFFGRGAPDVPALRKTVENWLRPAEGADLHEWAYLKARPLLIAEEMIGGGDSPPGDYKFYVFSGEVATANVHADRFGDHTERWYLPDWTPLDVTLGENIQLSPVVPTPPGTYEKMTTIAVALAGSYDFIRVDLYSVGEDVFFGELSPYPSSGLERFRPVSFDRQLGEKWKLPVL